MNILFLGDGQWARISLKNMINMKDINVVGIVLRYNKPDRELEAIGKGNNIPIYMEKDINNHEVIDKFANFNIDLGVSMSFDQIIKVKLRNISKHGFINCHAGKLPNYRGRNILNWALINDEKEIGITAHYIDDGIDTGDIISQAIIPIEESDNYATLLNKAIAKCPEVLIDAIYKIKDNRVKTIKQSHINGSYFSYRRDGDELIDWNWESRRIYNFIRALVDPSPGAQTYLDEKKIYIWDSEEISYPNYISTPGEIIARLSDGIIVKTGDSAIKIKLISVSPNDEKIVPKFQVGKRFGINLYEKVIQLEKEIIRLKNGTKNII